MKRKLRVVASSGHGIGVKLIDVDTGEEIQAAWSKAEIIIEAGQLTKAVITFEGVEVDAVVEEENDDASQDA